MGSLIRQLWEMIQTAYRGTIGERERIFLFKWTRDWPYTYKVEPTASGNHIIPPIIGELKGQRDIHELILFNSREKQIDTLCEFQL